MTMPMKKIFAAIALPLVLVACVNREPVDDAVLEGMLDRPVGSYTLQPREEGHFALVVKLSEFSNNNAISEQGEKGASLCATFNQIRVSLAQDGSLHATYSWSGYRSYSALTQEVDLSGDTVTMPATVQPEGGSVVYRLEAAQLTHCRFTPDGNV